MKNKKNIIIIISVIVLLFLTAIITYFVLQNENKKFVSFSLNAPEVTQSELPLLVLFVSPHCKYCHKFLPTFYKSISTYKDNFKYVILNTWEPENRALVQSDVSETPSVFIYDPIIGNKVHIPVMALQIETRFRFELDRYIRLRSFIDIEKAKASLKH
jgi:thiol-disulfide isomerase/thioredoxin